MTRCMSRRCRYAAAARSRGKARPFTTVVSQPKGCYVAPTTFESLPEDPRGENRRGPDRPSAVRPSASACVAFTGVVGRLRPAAHHTTARSPSGAAARCPSRRPGRRTRPSARAYRVRRRTWPARSVRSAFANSRSTLPICQLSSRTSLATKKDTASKGTRGKTGILQLASFTSGSLFILARIKRDYP
jgi:hypothetical protein